MKIEIKDAEVIRHAVIECNGCGQTAGEFVVAEMDPENAQVPWHDLWLCKECVQSLLDRFPVKEVAS